MNNTHPRLQLSYWLKALLCCVLFTLLLMGFSFLKSFFPASAERWAHGILGSVAAVIATFVFIRLDRSSFKAAGLVPDKGSPGRFLVGFFIGIGLMGLLTAGVIFGSGFMVEMNPRSTVLHFLVATLPLIPLAWMEEAGFRGYPYQQLEKGYGALPAIFISALLFGAYHLANGWTFQAAFLGAGVWGLVFGLARAWSKGIALPTGMHYAANLTTSAFGVSEQSSSPFILYHPSVGHGMEQYKSSEWEILLPQLILMVLALLFIGIYLRYKENSAGRDN